MSQIPDRKAQQAAVLLQAGRAALQSGELEKAEKLLAAAAAADPSAAAPWFSMASIHVKRGKSDLACLAFARAKSMSEDLLESLMPIAASANVKDQPALRHRIHMLNQIRIASADNMVTCSEPLLGSNSGWMTSLQDEQLGIAWDLACRNLLSAPLESRQASSLGDGEDLLGGHPVTSPIKHGVRSSKNSDSTMNPDLECANGVSALVFGGLGRESFLLCEAIRVTGNRKECDSENSADLAATAHKKASVSQSVLSVHSNELTRAIAESFCEAARIFHTMGEDDERDTRDASEREEAAGDLDLTCVSLPVALGERISLGKKLHVGEGGGDAEGDDHRTVSAAFSGPGDRVASHEAKLPPNFQHRRLALLAEVVSPRIPFAALQSFAEVAGRLLKPPFRPVPISKSTGGSINSRHFFGNSANTNKADSDLDPDARDPNPNCLAARAGLEAAGGPFGGRDIVSPSRLALVGALVSSRDIMQINEVDLECMRIDTDLEYGPCNEMLWRPSRPMKVSPQCQYRLLSKPFVIKEVDLAAFFNNDADNVEDTAEIRPNSKRGSGVKNKPKEMMKKKERLTVEIPVTAPGQADCVVAWTEFVLADSVPSVSNSNASRRHAQDAQGHARPGVVLSYAPPEVEDVVLGTANTNSTARIPSTTDTENVSKGVVIVRPTPGPHTWQHVFYLSHRAQVVTGQRLFVDVTMDHAVGDVRIEVDESRLFEFDVGIPGSGSPQFLLPEGEAILDLSGKGGDVVSESRGGCGSCSLDLPEGEVLLPMGGPLANNSSDPSDDDDGDSHHQVSVEGNEDGGDAIKDKDKDDSSRSSSSTLNGAPKSVADPIAAATAILPYHLSMLNDRERTVRYRDGIRTAVHELLGERDRAEEASPRTDNHNCISSAAPSSSSSSAAAVAAAAACKKASSNHGLNHADSPVQVLDVGSGSGLLSLLTAKAAKEYFLKQCVGGRRDPREVSSSIGQHRSSDGVDTLGGPGCMGEPSESGENSRRKRNDSEKLDLMALSTSLTENLKIGTVENDDGGAPGVSENSFSESAAFESWVQNQIRILGCERELSLAMTAKALVDVNGFGSGKLVSFAHCFSSELVVAEEGRNGDKEEAGEPAESNHPKPDSMLRRADLVVHEIFGTDPLSEGVLPTMRHVKSHLASPSARFVPGAFTVVAALASCPRLRSRTFEAPIVFQAMENASSHTTTAGTGACVNDQGADGDVDGGSGGTAARLSEVQAWAPWKAEVNLLQEFPDDCWLLTEPTPVLHFCLEGDPSNPESSPKLDPKQPGFRPPFAPGVVQKAAADGLLLLNGEAAVAVPLLPRPLSVARFARTEAEAVQQAFYRPPADSGEREGEGRESAVARSEDADAFFSPSAAVEDVIHADSVVYWFEADMGVRELSQACSSELKNGPKKSLGSKDACSHDPSEASIDGTASPAGSLLSTGPGHTLFGHWVQNVQFLTETIPIPRTYPSVVNVSAKGKGQGQGRNERTSVSSENPGASGSESEALSVGPKEGEASADNGGIRVVLRASYAVDRVRMGASLVEASKRS